MKFIVALALPVCWLIGATLAATEPAPSLPPEHLAPAKNDAVSVKPIQIQRMQPIDWKPNDYTIAYESQRTHHGRDGRATSMHCVQARFSTSTTTDFNLL